jgi:hypothetical protein
MKPWANQLHAQSGHDYDNSANSSAKASNDTASGQDSEFETLQTGEYLFNWINCFFTEQGLIKRGRTWCDYLIIKIDLN